MAIETLKSPNPRNRNSISLIKSKFLSVSSMNTLLAILKVTDARRDVILAGGLYHRFPWRYPPLRRAGNFFFTAHALIGYFEVTWHLTIKTVSHQNLWAGNIAKAMTSEGHSALLPANVDRRPLLQLGLMNFQLHFIFFSYITNQLKTGLSGTVSFVSLGTSY